MEFFTQWNKYRFRILTEEDIPLIHELLEGNPLYFQHCPPAPTHESIRQDMCALPPGKALEDKHYGGLFNGKRLIALFDLITGFPNEKTLFIGFFMVKKEEQGNGLGTEIISELCRDVSAKGFEHIRLGYVKGNPQSEAFWMKNGFVKTGVETQTGGYTVVVLEKDL